jgi:Integral peroxisomal membrane peroxin
MAAFDTPLINQILSTSTQQRPRPHSVNSASSTINMAPSKQEAKSTILAQFPPGQQPVGTSPEILDSTANLLASTPPQIVRALGQADPLIRGLNTILGLLTWTSGQDWLSFFLLVGWWVTCLYGSMIVKFAGNFIPVVFIVVWYFLHKTGISLYTSVLMG